MGGDMRSGRRAGVGRWRCKQHAGSTQLDIGGEARAGRTLNIPDMVVTLEVSQLDTSSLNDADKPLVVNNPLMSVIKETFQLEMGPYVLMVFALPYIGSAASSSSRVVKAKGGWGGGNGDGGGGDGGGGDGVGGGGEGGGGDVAVTVTF